MPKPRVYIETTIPSAYFERRTAPEFVARRNWTREWWSRALERYTLLTSEAVLDELSRGIPEHATERLSLIQNLLLLPIEPEISEVVQVYLRHKLMPTDTSGDALHLALASFHQCNFLLTWNCTHLANANKFEHIGRVNMILGLYPPKLVTPLQLLGESYEAE